MDLSTGTLGLIRRFVGLAGVIVVALGVKDQASVDTAVHSFDVLLGSGMVLLDFGYSVFHKLTGK